jgi:hypothetical protein
MDVSIITATAFCTSFFDSENKNIEAVLITFSCIPSSFPLGFELIFDKLSNAK